MPTTASRLIDLVLDGGPKALLKAAGFRKVRRHFYADRQSAIWHLEIQSSMYNGSGHTRFTINVSQCIPEINQDLNCWPYSVKSESEKSYRSTVGIRIGHLMPEQEDHWWEIAGEADVPRVSAEVEEALNRHAIPYLERTSTVEGIANYENPRARFGLKYSLPMASALAIIGRKSDAQVAFDMATKDFRVLPEELFVWSKRHGLKVPEGFSNAAEN